jgi:hypothetical protein
VALEKDGKTLHDLHQLWLPLKINKEQKESFSVALNFILSLTRDPTSLTFII